MPDAITETMIAPLALLPAILMAALRPGKRPGSLPMLSELAAFAAFGLTLAGLAQTAFGATAGVAILEAPFTLGLRADLVAASLAALVGFIGWIVLRYSRTYLDGEAREGAFHGLMLTALAAVLVFVQAGTLPTLILATVAVGLALKRLLLFYPDRPEAQRAATKFAAVWHIGDIMLVIAATLLSARFSTLDLAALPGAAAETGLGLAGTLGIAAIVTAAALKTAAFPMHGWLTEVMEAPTPVSALLHAGIINSGGVLLR
jgi:NAD(P)H-quinone oxidoreductase subunit 5